MGQEQAWIISLVLMVLVIAPFLFIAMYTSRDEADYAPIAVGAGKVRKLLFLGLVAVFTPVMVYTLTSLPYGDAVAGDIEPFKVNAVGYQWYWEIDNTTLPLGQPVEFHVTSADVNHGFGVYNADMRLVAQTQGMPGYTNVLRHTFDQPGTYKILCLEYCGLAHHSMITELTVAESVAAVEGGAS